MLLPRLIMLFLLGRTFWAEARPNVVYLVQVQHVESGLLGPFRRALGHDGPIKTIERNHFEHAGVKVTASSSSAEKSWWREAAEAVLPKAVSPAA